MADINESSANVDKPEAYLGRKRPDVREDGENDDDDDDDVVMDKDKSPRHNGDGVSDRLANGSKSPITPRKPDDASKPATRPGTATINTNMGRIEDEQDASSRPFSPNIISKITKDPADESTPFFSQSRSPSATSDNKEQKGEEGLGSRPLSSKEFDIKNTILPVVDGSNDKLDNKTSSLPNTMLTPEPIETIKRLGSPYSNDASGNVEQSLMTPPKSSDNSRSITPSHLDAPHTAEQELKTPSRTPDKSRSSTPAGLEPPENADSKSPFKTPDKSRSSTPGELGPFGNAGRESRTSESRTPDKSRASTPAGLLETMETRTPDKSRSNTPGIPLEPEETSKIPDHDETDDTLQVPSKPSRPTSSLNSPNVVTDKGSKSPKSPRSPMASQNKLPMPESEGTPSKSPDEGVKGFDNGQQRSLSSASTLRSPSPRPSAGSAKQADGEKKRASFVEDLASTKKTVEIADKEPTPTSPSKPTTPTAKTPRMQTPKSLDEKIPRKSAGKKGSRAFMREMDNNINCLSNLDSCSPSARTVVSFFCITIFEKKSEMLYVYLLFCNPKKTRLNYILLFAIKRYFNNEYFRFAFSLSLSLMVLKKLGTI